MDRGERIAELVHRGRERILARAKRSTKALDVATEGLSRMLQVVALCQERDALARGPREPVEVGESLVQPFGRSRRCQDAAIAEADEGHRPVIVADDGWEPAVAHVTAAYVSGSGWTQPFRDALSQNGLGSPRFGFNVTSAPSAPLPWTSLQRLREPLELDDVARGARAGIGRRHQRLGGGHEIARGRGRDRPRIFRAARDRDADDERWVRREREREATELRDDPIEWEGAAQAHRHIGGDGRVALRRDASRGDDPKAAIVLERPEPGAAHVGNLG